MSKGNWSSVSLQKRNQLLQLYEQGISLEGEAKKLGMKPDSMGRAIRRHRAKIEETNISLAATVKFASYNSRYYDDYVVLEQDNAIIISDLEYPDVDPEVCRLATLLGIKNAIKTLIIAGDAIATDQDTLNSWNSTWAEESDMTYEAVIKYLHVHFKQLLEWFDEIFIIEGNHDDRIARVTSGHVHLGMLLNIEKVEYSRYSYMYMKTKRGTYYICHPSNYSQHPSSLGKALHDAHHYKGEKCHVILAHTHLAEDATSRDGLRRVHSLGCGRHPSKTKYKSKSSNKYPEWVRGIGMVRNGYFHNFPIEHTDWSYHLGNMTPKEYIR